MTASDRLHGYMTQIAFARRRGDDGAVEELLAQLEGAMGQPHRMLAEKALEAARRTEAGDLGPHDIGLNEPGTRMCDFCSSLEPVVFYPFEEFTIEAVAEWRSGDRMYACVVCRALVDAGDWRGLRRHVGEAARSPGVVLLWMGFRVNRTTSEAVAFEAGTDPEAGRP